MCADLAFGVAQTTVFESPASMQRPTTGLPDAAAMSESQFVHGQIAPMMADIKETSAPLVSRRLWFIALCADPLSDGLPKPFTPRHELRHLDAFHPHSESSRAATPSPKPLPLVGVSSHRTESERGSPLLEEKKHQQQQQQPQQQRGAGSAGGAGTGLGLGAAPSVGQNHHREQREQFILDVKQKSEESRRMSSARNRELEAQALKVCAAACDITRSFWKFTSLWSVVTEIGATAAVGEEVAVNCQVRGQGARLQRTLVSPCAWLATQLPDSAVGARPEYRPIEEHGLIGNMRTVALIGTDAVSCR